MFWLCILFILVCSWSTLYSYFYHFFKNWVFEPFIQRGHQSLMGYKRRKANCIFLDYPSLWIKPTEKVRTLVELLTIPRHMRQDKEPQVDMVTNVPLWSRNGFNLKIPLQTFNKCTLLFHPPLLHPLVITVMCLFFYCGKYGNILILSFLFFPISRTSFYCRL